MPNCCICGNPSNVENAHPFAKGMGGRGPKAPARELVTFPLCAGTAGNTDPTSCHGAHHAHYLMLDVTTDGRLAYRSTRLLEADTNDARAARKALTRRGLRLDGLWQIARYEYDEWDAVDVPRGA